MGLDEKGETVMVKSMSCGERLGLTHLPVCYGRVQNALSKGEGEGV